MDKYKNHLQSYLQISLLVLLFLSAVAIEVICVKSFSIYTLLLILAGQFFFSRSYNSKAELEAPDRSWLLLALTIPFAVFYDSYSSDGYFLIMSVISGIVVGYSLSAFCVWLAKIFTVSGDEYLAGEAKMVGRCLLGLPLFFIGIIIYLIISVRGGLHTLLSIGDLVLVKRFPLIMMIGAIFPAILVGRALMVFYRRKDND